MNYLSPEVAEIIYGIDETDTEIDIDKKKLIFSDIYQLGLIFL